MTGRIRVLIADDSPSFRAGLKAALERDSEIQVIGLAADGHAAAPRSPQEHGMSGSGKRILIVDDSPAMRALIKVHLADTGAEFSEASDGIEALELARRERPALVISDIKMPKMDGVRFCEELRKDPRLKETPVIVLTSEHNAENYLRCREVGVSSFLGKPLDPAVLLERVGRFVVGSSSAEVRTALIVDDSPTIRSLVKAHLTGLGLGFLEAADGSEALAIARAKRPAVIVLDLRMPQMDGLTFCQRLRRAPEYRAIPIVILTSDTDPEAEARAKAAGAKAFLRKPIVSAELRTTVERCLKAER